MPKVEWGKKVVCTNCETKFYDLNRKPAVCPACGTEYIEVISDTSSNNAKQVFTQNVDEAADYNLVGSDASESVAEVEDIDIDDGMDEDTISLEESETDVEVMSDTDSDDVVDLNINENNPNEEEN